MLARSLMMISYQFRLLMLGVKVDEKLWRMPLHKTMISL